MVLRWWCTVDSFCFPIFVYFVTDFVVIANVPIISLRPSLGLRVIWGWETVPNYDDGHKIHNDLAPVFSAVVTLDENRTQWTEMWLYRRFRASDTDVGFTRINSGHLVRWSAAIMKWRFPSLSRWSTRHVHWQLSKNVIKRQGVIGVLKCCWQVCLRYNPNQHTLVSKLFPVYKLESWLSLYANASKCLYPPYELGLLEMAMRWVLRGSSSHLISWWRLKEIPNGINWPDRKLSNLQNKWTNEFGGIALPYDDVSSRDSSIMDPWTRSESSSFL